MRSYGLIRLDGENWESMELSENKLTVDVGKDFEGWESWKKSHKEGINCVFEFRRDGNTITTITENLGIKIKNVTTILDTPEEVYFSLTGDQCAITNIRIERPGPLS